MFVPTKKGSYVFRRSAPFPCFTSVGPATCFLVLATVICSPAFGTGYTLSLASHRLVSCFPAPGNCYISAFWVYDTRNLTGLSEITLDLLAVSAFSLIRSSSVFKLPNRAAT